MFTKSTKIIVKIKKIIPLSVLMAGVGILGIPASFTQAISPAAQTLPPNTSVQLHFYMDNAASEAPYKPVRDTYYAVYRNKSWEIPEELIKTNDFWIAVDLTQQMLYAYRGNQVLAGFLISSGRAAYKTVTGVYQIFAKYPAVDMTGPGYHLPDVPYSMFFHQGYAIHGTYWHTNFGRPASRGCVNMITEEAAWLYEHAPAGTYVIVYY